MKHLILTILSLSALANASALDLGTYASNSRLADGTWVKISVDQTGMYRISGTMLKQWGFTNPENVRVYGYGGARIPDLLNKDNYIDDLPLAQSEYTDQGLVFYGVGPEAWSINSSTSTNLSNIYSDVGYYFLTENAEDFEIPSQGLAQATNSPSTSYLHREQHEYDRVSPGEAGYLLVGESFKSQATRKFTFEFPAAGEASFECGIVSNSSFSSKINFSVNGQALDFINTDVIPITSVNSYLHGMLSVTSHSFEGVKGSNEISVNVSNASSMNDCWLDYLAVNVTVPLQLNSKGWLVFESTSSAVLDVNSFSNVKVWDVTNPQAISQLNIANENGSVKWTNDYSGTRKYAAWSPDATLLTPVHIGKVSNQDIHAIDVPDMVIFSPAVYASQAQRIVDMHAKASRPLKAIVLDVDKVYNEFSSGVPDVSGLRKCLKMFYDRSTLSGDSLPSLQYALIIGRATYDNRHLTAQFEGSGNHPTVPYWIGGERKTQLSDNTAFGTDDFLAILGDKSGSNLGMDDLSVSVGRIPATSLDGLKSYIDKLEDYILNSKPGTWKNHFLFLADDGNESKHILQTENIISEILNTENSQAFVSKVYVDAYPIVGGICQGGREDMYRMLDEGVVWWNFCGHASNHAWTGEKMLTYNDINNLYLKKIPVLLAATCDFLRWDSNTFSGAEIMFYERNGGTISTISATRPVYISDNGYFTRAVGRVLNARDDNGNLLRVGDIYRTAKNNILDDTNKHINNANRLRYVLMGDPAMALQMPSNIVRLDSIGDIYVDPEKQITLKALERTTLTGSILNPQGQLIEDFNGSIEAIIYDAEKSITTLGRGGESENLILTVDQHGDKLFCGSGKVTNGHFSIAVSMPGEVADNFRPASINFYAISDSNVEAVGVNRDFFVYGLDESVPEDTVPPMINALYLNRESFQPNSTVNSAPMVIAEISDNVGINLSSAGIGHEMTITLDGKKTFTDVSLYYTPSSDGESRGTINYPMTTLTDGQHSITLRVWDTNANSASKTIDFNVSSGLAPVIYDCYTTQNPVSTEAKFYVEHDRPNSEITVTIEVFSLMGRLVWEHTSTGRADMVLSAPIVWNLCDMSGRRVPRGIYAYRATVSESGGESHSTASRKLAVTAQ